MVAANPYHAMPSARPSRVPLDNRVAERVRQYFDLHPEVPREEFLLQAVQRELYFREQREMETGRRTGGGAARPTHARPALTAEDIRVHAWLLERLATLHHERHGLWPRLKRFLFGKRPRRR